MVSKDPPGFDGGESEPPLDLEGAQDGLAVCSDTFEEFLYRYWIDNELFFRLAVDHEPLSALPPEMRAYVAGYPGLELPHVTRPGMTPGS